jgi:hypothetical protein
MTRAKGLYLWAMIKYITKSKVNKFSHAYDLGHELGGITQLDPSQFKLSLFQYLFLQKKNMLNRHLLRKNLKVKLSFN